ncbi:MAG: hypothetical protein WDM90_08935 [Ferruginibacter sp.]
MNGYLYKDSISSTTCGALVSATAKLSVNPTPTITLSASPYKKLYPGLTTTISSTVTPAAATYTWLKNGTTVANATSGALQVDVTGLGDYSLRSYRCKWLYQHISCNFHYRFCKWQVLHLS